MLVTSKGILKASARITKIIIIARSVKNRLPVIPSSPIMTVPIVPVSFKNNTIVSLSKKPSYY